jgi:RecA/RadA recombinase
MRICLDTAARSAAARWMLETGRSLSDARQMDISTETQRTERISTGAQRLDALLDGGLCLGQLVEVRRN